jgi:hypothetical protein
LDKWQAQQAFWEGFGLPAYDERTVPEEVWNEVLQKMVKVEMPYITYEAVGGDLGAQTTISASLWYRSNSWAEISQKADQIAQQIALAEKPAIKIDNGFMKVRLPDGMPFAQRMDEPSDKQVRRIVLTVEIEFLTAY